MQQYGIGWCSGSTYPWIFLDASNAQFGGGWTLAPQQKTKEEGFWKTRKSPLKDAVLASVVAEHVDLPMDDYTKALCEEK